MTPRPPKSLPWAPLLVAALALLLLAGAAGNPFAAIPVSPEALAQSEPAAPATRRCPECGWIEARRDIASGTDNRAIRIQEYTVRMVDGSSRVFTGGPADRWRLGERLIYIDGAP